MPDNGSALEALDARERAELEASAQSYLDELAHIWERGICRDCGREDATVKEEDALICLACRSAYGRYGTAIVSREPKPIPIATGPRPPL